MLLIGFAAGGLITALTVLLTALNVISECAKIDGERCTAIECLRSTIKEQIDDGGDIRNARD